MTFYNGIYYSEIYSDANFDYRHIILPEEIAAKLPKNRLLGEHEWRGLGVQQSIGWEHFMIHEPEPHILLFRRPATKKFETGKSTGARSVQNFK